MFSRLTPVRTSAPAARIISTAEAKAHLRVDASDDDTLIAALVMAAEEMIDGYTGILRRALITQTWKEFYPYFNHQLSLRMGPVQSVSSVKYYDANNVLQTVSTDIYRLHEEPGRAYLVELDNQSWPGNTRSRDDAVEVIYVCGHGDASTDVPQPIIQAALMLVAAWYENRQPVASGLSELPFGVQALLAPWKRR